MKKLSDSYKKSSILSSFGMFVLAASPMLFYYYIGETNIRLLSILGVSILFFILFSQKIRLSILPKSYLIFWVWCALHMYFISGVATWTDYLPGGMNLCMFSLLLVSMSTLYDFEKLYLYMKWIFIIATILLIFQYLVFFTSGTKICVFPMLTNKIGWQTAHELYLRHTQGTVSGIDRFSSIFIEPSYFGQYGIILLAMNLFRNEMKDKLFSPFSIFIVAVLLLLRSGTGLLCVLIVSVIKVLYIVFLTRNKKYYFLLLIFLPIIFIFIRYYLISEAGVYVTSRISELDNTQESTSGYNRIFYGWYFFDSLSPVEKIIGTSRAVAMAMFEDGFSNLASSVATSLGLIGLILLICFYLKECKYKSFITYGLFFSFIPIALIEACYLGGLMLIVSTVIISTKRDLFLT